MHMQLTHADALASRQIEQIGRQRKYRRQLLSLQQLPTGNDTIQYIISGCVPNYVDHAFNCKHGTMQVYLSYV